MYIQYVFQLKIVVLLLGKFFTFTIYMGFQIIYQPVAEYAHALQVVLIYIIVNVRNNSIFY